MATVVVIKDLSAFPLSRQDLSDAWSTAQLSTIVDSDLSSAYKSVTTASTFSDLASSPNPGQMTWVFDEQVMYCYHDEIGDTGVSLWLAIGPDVFETACLAGEPLPAAAVVEPWFDRWVKLADQSEPLISGDVRHKAIGTVHSGVPWPMNSRSPDTQASGTWVRVGIDGFCYFWIPDTSGDSTGLYGIDGQRYLHVSDLVKGGVFEDGPGSGVPQHDGYIGRSLAASFNAAAPTTVYGHIIRGIFTGYKFIVPAG